MRVLHRCARWLLSDRAWDRWCLWRYEWCLWRYERDRRVRRAGMLRSVKRLFMFALPVYVVGIVSTIAHGMWTAVPGLTIGLVWLVSGRVTIHLADRGVFQGLRR